MAAPKKPNTVAATAAVVRNAQERKAASLRQSGWICLPPEVVKSLHVDVRECLAAARSDDED